MALTMADEKLIERASALSRMLDAWAYRIQIRAWLQESALGFVSDRHGYTVTGRSVGALTLTLADGTRRDMQAPVPLA